LALKDLDDNWRKVLQAGPAIVRGAELELPSLDEAKYAEQFKNMGIVRQGDEKHS
jgi:hypothetical protein